MKLLSNEFKIGIFVILAGAVGFVFWARTQKSTADTYTVKTYFKFVSGLKENLSSPCRDTGGEGR
jgi:ABC-type transporter Mla subunit MlaD